MRIQQTDNILKETLDPIPTNPFVDLSLGALWEIIQMTAENDESLRMPAIDLLKWAFSHQEKFLDNSQVLYSEILSIILNCINKNRKSKLHYAIYDFIASTNYWSKFGTLTPISPLLTCHLTVTIYTTLLKVKNPALQCNQQDEALPELTPDEEGALGYVAGFIIRSTIKKVTIRNRASKNDLLLLLFHFLEDPETSDQLEVNAIEDWCRIIDRGGLYHATAEFKSTLRLAERKIKQQLKDVPTNNTT